MLSRPRRVWRGFSTPTVHTNDKNPMNRNNHINPRLPTMSLLGGLHLKSNFLAVLAVGLGLATGTALAAPANDDFANAIDLTGGGAGQTGSVTSGDQTGTNSIDATAEAGEPAFPGLNKTVWFKWTSPGDGQFTFQTNGSTNGSAGEWDSMIGIYTGAAVNALTPLGTTPKDSGSAETMTITVTPGTTYYIQLAGFGGEDATNILLTWNYVATVYQADILSFGPSATIGPVVANAANIAWTVPFGSNLATLAPTFTLSLRATCTVDSNPVVSGGTVDFSGGPKDYVITSQGATIVNTYTVTITVGPPPNDGTWATDGNGNWSDPANWASNTVAIGADKTATFPDIITGDRIVTLDSPFTIGNLLFADASHKLTISGANPLTLDVTSGSSQVAVTGGTARVLQISSDLVSNDPLSKTGNGILRLSAAAYNFPSISVAGGTLDFSSATNDTVTRTLGGGNYAGNIDIATGATFQFWRNTGTQEFSGVISGGGNVRLAHKGIYTLSGANTYTGKTTIHGEYNGNTASLNVSSFNSVNGGTPPLASSSLGAPTTVANGTVDIGRTSMQASAVLNYTGAGETTDRVMNLVASGNAQRKVVNNLGTGTLTFTSPWIGPAGLNNTTMPIITNADMILTGSVPDNFVALEKHGNARLSLSGPCTIYGSVRLHAGTLEIDSEINDGGVYGGAITTGSGNGGTNFIAVPAGTPIAVGMSVVHPRFALGTTVLSIVDINANPVEAQVSSNSDTATRTETGYIGFKGALGIIPPTADRLRWLGDATLKYDGPDDSTNRSFTVDNDFTATWEIITGSTLTVSGATTNTTGKLTKTGDGTLVFSGALLHSGVNNVNAGTLLINGDSSGMTGAVTVASGATLGGGGTIGGATTVNGKLAPGASVGTLTFVMGGLTLGSLAANSLEFELGADTTAGTTYDTVVTSSLDIGTLDFADFKFTNTGTLAAGTYTLISSGAAITGLIGTAGGTIGAFTGTLSISGNNLILTVAGGSDPFATWAAAKGLDGTAGKENGKADDPDGDGKNNNYEFAFNGDPLDGSDNGLIAGLVQDASAPAGNELTLVVAVRDGVSFTGSGTPVVQSHLTPVDGVTYTIQGTLDLATIPGSDVAHVGGPSDTAPVATGLPDLTGTAWEYHTFKLVASEGLGGKGFLRAKVE